MKIPTYKLIRILSSNKLDIDAQLKSLEFGFLPYVFDLSLIDNPQQALDHIENYLADRNISGSPYPLCVLSQEELISEFLPVYESLNMAPVFYNQKSKNPNVKEQNVLNRLELKRRNFESLKTLDYIPVLKRYSIAHKVIADIAKEAFCYEQLLHKLKEETDGQ